MTTGEIDVVRFSDAWGRSPSTFTLVTLAVGIAPDAVAFEGANDPITFAALHARAAVTAGALQASTRVRTAAQSRPAASLNQAAVVSTYSE